MRKYKKNEKMYFCLLMVVMILIGGMGGAISYGQSMEYESLQSEQIDGNKIVESKPKIFQIPDFDPIPPINIRVITQAFNEAKKHYGVDIVADISDAPIMAVENGIVEKADFGKALGNYIKIRHNNGYLTNYFHCKELYVKAGQVVNRGDVIGMVGTTGNSTGPHLHFELHIDGVPVDPIHYVDLNIME